MIKNFELLSFIRMIFISSFCMVNLYVFNVEHLVEPGDLDPNQIHTPGVYVHRVLPLTPEQAADKRIERSTIRPKPAEEAA